MFKKTNIVKNNNNKMPDKQLQVNNDPYTLNSNPAKTSQSFVNNATNFPFRYGQKESQIDMSAFSNEMPISANPVIGYNTKSNVISLNNEDLFPSGQNVSTTTFIASNNQTMNENINILPNNIYNNDMYSLNNMSNGGDFLTRLQPRSLDENAKEEISKLEGFIDNKYQNMPERNINGNIGIDYEITLPNAEVLDNHYYICNDRQVNVTLQSIPEEGSDTDITQENNSAEEYYCHGTTPSIVEIQESEDDKDDEKINPVEIPGGSVHTIDKATYGTNEERNSHLIHARNNEETKPEERNPNINDVEDNYFKEGLKSIKGTPQKYKFPSITPSSTLHLTLTDKESKDKDKNKVEDESKSTTDIKSEGKNKSANEEEKHNTESEENSVNEYKNKLDNEFNDNVLISNSFNNKFLDAGNVMPLVENGKEVLLDILITMFKHYNTTLDLTDKVNINILAKMTEHRKQNFTPPFIIDSKISCLVYSLIDEVSSVRSMAKKQEYPNILCNDLIHDFALSTEIKYDFFITKYHRQIHGEKEFKFWTAINYDLALRYNILLIFWGKKYDNDCINSCTSPENMSNLIRTGIASIISQKRGDHIILPISVVSGEGYFIRGLHDLEDNKRKINTNISFTDALIESMAPNIKVLRKEVAVHTRSKLNKPMDFKLFLVRVRGSPIITYVNK